MVKGNITETTTIDFDGDGRLDYIVFVSNNEPENADIVGTEIWISSALKIVKRQPKYNAGADFKWFINLDNDPVPEIVSAFGYEDGIAYSIYKQNLRDKPDTLLLRFNPIIDASNKGKYYWGYPWDISGIRAWPRGNHFEILCSFDHNVEGDFLNVDIPRWQRWIPIIFLIGKTTQPEATVNEVGTKRWMSIKEIARKVRSKKR
jgi:hypothetical protein